MIETMNDNSLALLGSWLQSADKKHCGHKACFVPGLSFSGREMIIFLPLLRVFLLPGMHFPLTPTSSMNIQILISLSGYVALPPGSPP